MNKVYSTSTEASFSTTRVSVEMFNPRLSILKINRWLLGHNLNLISPKHIPDTGFLLKEDGNEIGCVFLYLTNSKLALIEGCIANPEYPKGKIQE